MKKIESGGHLNAKYVISEAASKVAEAGVVLLMPTDAMYCLVCAHGDAAAINKINHLKKHYKSKSFQLYALDIEAIVKAGCRPSKLARQLAAALCPAQLTIVDKHEDEAPLAFKITNHPFMQMFLEELENPLTISSAGAAAYTVPSALSGLLGEPDYVIDFGTLKQGVALSTVVEIDGGNFKILREGAVPAEKIKQALA